MNALIVMDAGTTGVKANLIERSGRILGSHQASYSSTTKGNTVEQQPEDWWRAAIECLRAITAELGQVTLDGIALSGQMQNLILGSKGEVIAPAILYSDTRAQSEAEIISQQIGEVTLQSATGNLQDASSLLAKLLWLKKHRSRQYTESDILMIGAHDFLAWKLCGVHLADYTTAATTGLLDLHANAWALDILTALNLRTDFLPTLAPSGTLAGHLHHAAAAATGLPSGLPIYHGSGDAATATVGAGAGEPGHFYAYLGSSGWLAATRHGEPVDPGSGIFNLRHPDTKRLILIGPMLTAAGNFGWLNATFGELEAIVSWSSTSDSYAALERSAAEAKPGSGGVLYLPHLAGERAPFRDPHARGVFFGLSTTTTRADIYRAVLEGVTLSMRAIRETMLTSELETISVLNLVGGGARSALWAQIFADVFDCQVNVLAGPSDAGTRGAAIITGKALGWHDSYIPPGDFFPLQSSFTPQPSSLEVYNQSFEVFRQIYPALKPVFAAHAANSRGQVNVRSLSSLEEG
jgi:xylulokinase